MNNGKFSKQTLSSWQEIKKKNSEVVLIYHLLFRPDLKLSWGLHKASPRGMTPGYISYPSFFAEIESLGMKSPTTLTVEPCSLACVLGRLNTRDKYQRCSIRKPIVQQSRKYSQRIRLIDHQDHFVSFRFLEGVNHNFIKSKV